MTDPVYDLTLTGFAYGGDALGRLPAANGIPERVVFVPFGIPGERVRVRIIEERRGFARAQLLEVLQAAPERAVPRCRHFGICGGCHYQHMPYELQLKAKTDILRDQFRRIGHIEAPPVMQAIPSAAPWNYRNHVQFHLTREGRLGYVAHSAPLPAAQSTNPPLSRSGDLRVLPITDCHLPEMALNELWPQLVFESGSGVQRVSLRQGADDDLLVSLESDWPDLPEIEMEAGVSLVHLFEEHSAVLAGSGQLIMQILGRAFQVSAPSFFQVNTAMVEQMVKHVLQIIQSVPGIQQSTILDLYCGVGLFSAFLAPLCARLVGIESSPSACEDFTVNLDEFDNVELYEDAVENVLPALDASRPTGSSNSAVVLADPPRMGLAPAALDAIVRLAPSSFVYVSCDPSTLARDAARLIKGGYRIRSSTPFDLFPQTYHIESITWFER